MTDLPETGQNECYSLDTIRHKFTIPYFNIPVNQRVILYVKQRLSNKRPIFILFNNL